MQTISQRLSNLNARIREYEHHYNREPGSVSLLAVSKTKPASAVLQAWQAGQRSFGENYLQDALAKISHPELQGITPEWHFIGPLQSNKTRPVAEHFHWLHTLDRLKIAQRLNDQRPPELPPLQVCLQIKLRDESTKSGLDPAQAPALAEAVEALPRLRFRGLMTMPPVSGDIEHQRQPFRELRELYDHLRHSGHDLDTLSMGMSNDMPAAIAEGSTMLRIGTAIFGTRN